MWAQLQPGTLARHPVCAHTLDSAGAQMKMEDRHWGRRGAHGRMDDDLALAVCTPVLHAPSSCAFFLRCISHPQAAKQSSPGPSL